jgi:putative membrane protein
MTSAFMAFLHHIFAFTVTACLVYEFVAFRKNMSTEDMRRIQRIDLAYGISAGLLLVVGLLRVFLYEKGWAFYMQSPFFWVKMATFLIVGILSIGPTIRFVHWNQLLKEDQSPVVSAADFERTRRILWLEITGIAVILLSAAFMARGIGFNQ